MFGIDQEHKDCVLVSPSLINKWWLPTNLFSGDTSMTRVQHEESAAWLWCYRNFFGGSIASSFWKKHLGQSHATNNSPKIFIQRTVPEFRWAHGVHACRLWELRLRLAGKKKDSGPWGLDHGSWTSSLCHTKKRPSWFFEKLGMSFGAMYWSN